jgi:cysteine desulfurase
VFTRILFDIGFCVSSGSACSNNTPKKGETLLAACQVSPAKASSAIRVSFGHDTTEDEIKLLAQTIGKESQSMGRLTRRR